jgi:hypothetical protein
MGGTDNGLSMNGFDGGVGNGRSIAGLKGGPGIGRMGAMPPGPHWACTEADIPFVANSTARTTTASILAGFLIFHPPRSNGFRT